MSFTPTRVTVRTGSAFTGTLSVVYRVEDGTKDPPLREASGGRLTVVVRDIPDTPAKPAIRDSGNGTVTLRWNEPANNNSPITGYRVTWTGGAGGAKDFDRTAAGADQPITGLANGTSYRFSVVAVNGKGVERRIRPVRSGHAVGNADRAAERHRLEEHDVCADDDRGRLGGPPDGGGGGASPIGYA